MVGLFLAVVTKVWMSERITGNTAGGVSALDRLHELLQRSEQSTELGAEEILEINAAVEAHADCTDTMTIDEEADLDLRIKKARSKECRREKTQNTAANTKGRRKRVASNHFSPEAERAPRKKKKKSVSNAPKAQKNWNVGDFAMCHWDIREAGWYSVTILEILQGGFFKVRSVKLYTDTIISHPHHLIRAPSRKQNGSEIIQVKEWQLAPPLVTKKRPNGHKEIRSRSSGQPSAPDVNEETNRQLPRHAAGDTVEALLKDTWHRAEVSEVNKDGSYAVKTQDVTWRVTPNLIRDVVMDLDNVDTIHHVNHEKLVRAVEAMAKKKKEEIKRLARNQLQCHVDCIAPVPYEHSQNYQHRRVEDGWSSFVQTRQQMKQPRLRNEFIYVGEQAFFGVTMLGTFSSGNWSMPLEGELNAEQETDLFDTFKEKSSFGRSCFVLVRTAMINEVRLSLRMRRDGSYVDPE